MPIVFSIFLLYALIAMRAIAINKITTPKLCINCKYFISDNQTNKYGKCSLFPNEYDKTTFLVNGVSELNYLYCSSVRYQNDMCGQNAKFYKKKYKKREKKGSP